MNKFSISRFFHRQDGAATVETVLWFPFFIAVFGLMFDTTMVFFTQSRVMSVVQEGNRELSIGRLADTNATENFIEGKLAAMDVSATAASQISSAGVVTTTVTVRAPEMDMIGYFTAIRNLEVTITADHMIENWES